MKRQFRHINFTVEQLRLIRRANEFIAEDDASKKTSRQIYYRFIGTDSLPLSWIDPVYNAKHGLPDDTKNTTKNYKRLCELLANARYAGLIDWDGIEDRVREPNHRLQFDNLRHRVESAIANYRLPRWRDQSSYVELWVEKEALAGILGSLAQEHHITLLVNKGYSSASAMFEAANRFREVAENGKHPVLLYVGDHDPSGVDMVRDIGARLSEFGAEVEVERVALDMGQIRKFKLPPNPAKITDSRAKAYIKRFGDRSWEVDALPPKELRRLINFAVQMRIDDPEALQRCLDEEEDGKKRLRAALKGVK